MDTYFSNEKNFDTGKIIIALDRNFNLFTSPNYNIYNILNEINAQKVELLFHSNKINNSNNISDILLIYLKNKEEIETTNAIAKLLNNPYVIYAEPDYLYDEYIIPNDPDFKYLWGMEKIKAPSAWNYTTGTYNTVIGVLDSGVDYNHPDIKNNMWISNNGQYVNGWNFIYNNNDPMDETNHGTHVAGTIGAVGNNFIGITGVCWNVQIAAFKIGNNRIDLAAAIKAIYFANLNRIPILNNSWGGSFYSSILKYAIEQYDGLFIASAGNNNSNNDFFPIYPASYDSYNIISVAATDQDDKLASFSNYGFYNVDIAAPGTNILSTSLNGEYTYKNGTSMAAPHVAGAAGLLKSYMPYLSTLEIKEIILQSSNKTPNLEGKILTSGILDIKSMIEMANCIRYNYRNIYLL